MASNPSLPTRRMCPWVLRRLFNESALVQRAAGGAVIARVTRVSPTHSEGHPLPGTRTQLVSYEASDGTVLAKASQFVLPDGTLAASGRPDPKWLRVGIEALIPGHGDLERCLDCPDAPIGKLDR